MRGIRKSIIEILGNNGGNIFNLSRLTFYNYRTILNHQHQPNPHILTSSHHHITTSTNQHINKSSHQQINTSTNHHINKSLTTDSSFLL
ncbi:MAG: hypothetical protein WCX14_05645, partial [Dysgonamonadaceae bacterium]